MIDVKQIEDVMRLAVEHSNADQLEVLASARETALTRFSNNHIHQNVSETNMGLSIRAAVGKRLGYASTNRLDADSVKAMVDRAVEMAAHRPPDDRFISLPSPKDTLKRDLVASSTVDCSPERRARQVEKLIRVAEDGDLTAAGAFSTGYNIIGIANTLGVLATTVVSDASLKTVMMAETSSGYGSAIAVDVDDIDVDQVASEAADKARMSIDPIDIEPGHYTVILEPDAVADMVSFMAFAGFGALSLQEGRSFMKERLGQEIVSPLISIWDDAFDDHTIGLPFDFEGVPKQKVSFIENGVAKGVCYDTYTAAKEGVESTGHGLPAPNIHGPLPLNLIVGAGNLSLSEMVRGSERAILVTSFHYTNLEDPIKTTLTGMTRDGTFLVENGEIKTGIKNLRFTQSILGALSQVEQVSDERQMKDAFLGTIYVPALKIRDFNFTGATQF
ncbi:MAG: TldD/PmbA family protein [Actinobacteria bacterium]|nr:TldD/PmbA family protein [Actinomycetota bacterium]